MSLALTVMANIKNGTTLPQFLLFMLPCLVMNKKIKRRVKIWRKTQLKDNKLWKADTFLKNKLWIGPSLELHHCIYNNYVKMTLMGLPQWWSKSNLHLQYWHILWMLFQLSATPLGIQLSAKGMGGQKWMVYSLRFCIHVGDKQKQEKKNKNL